MKYLFAFFIILIWFLITCILIFSIIGNLILLELCDEWFDIVKGPLSLFEE